MGGLARRLLVVLVVVSFASFGLLHDFDVGDAHAAGESNVVEESETVPHIDLLCSFLVVLGGLLFRAACRPPRRFGRIVPLKSDGLPRPSQRIRLLPAQRLFFGVCPLLA